MAFFTSKDFFTHKGSFYGIPLYFDLSDEIPTIAGTNIIFNDLFMLAVMLHNTIVEFGAQTMAAITGTDYEPGFPVYIKGAIEN